ncbi:MAG TPA: helix-turn-helix domain-containing protein [Solirubrobacteraceae bacterium]|nr:helix-turn-helix domain-containing protein [Solirubrobacteraceae bacterium]
MLTNLLAAGFSLDGIAREAQRSPSTVSYWLDKHGLEANGAARFAAKGGLSREQLAPLVSEGLSVPAIAQRLGCSPAMVRRWLDHYGLQTRQSSNRAKAQAALQRGERTTLLICSRHGEVMHVLEGRGSYRCTGCRAAAVAAWRRRVKKILVEEAGGRCRLCGYDRCSAALQFHHRDPAGKEFHLSHQGVSRSLSRARAEAAKCVLLCATCHAEVEAGFTSL